MVAARRMYRSSDDRMVAGVAGGLAEHLGLSSLWLRLGFAVLTVMGGTGALLYGLFWAVVPQRAGPPAGPRVATRERRAQLLALVLLVISGVVVGREVDLWFTGDRLWPAAMGAVGVALIWRQADDAKRARWTQPSGRMSVVRLLLGAMLVVAGVGAFLAANDELQAAREGVVATGAIVAGLALIFGPWSWRLAAELAEERRERIRTEERAEMAAHVHDSVLQTLALIQLHAERPQEVQRLARSQERDLRTWLYGRPTSSTGDRMAGAITAMATEVEGRHGTPVDVVTVGDCAVDERLAGLLLAAREAVVNAAKFSGSPVIDVYAEVDGGEVTVFVRDRGQGFDPDGVAGDRRGIAESIVGRMHRHGGRAEVRSTPGEGTEVELVMGAERR